jgi:hypothetical protein
MSTEAPLDIQLPTDTTKTAIPQIAAETWVKFRLTSIKKVIAEKGTQIKFEFDALDPVQSEDGTIIEPGKLGSKQLVTVPLYAKEGAKNPTWFVERVCKIMDAILGTGDPENKKGKPVRPVFNPEVAAAMTGGVFLGRMVKRKDEQGVERTEIGEFAFPADKQA